MGFMDKAKKLAEQQKQGGGGSFAEKAKKLAEQAQQKLDEVQTQFNESQKTSSGGGGTAAGGPAVEYDQHGRPIKRDDVPPSPAAATPEAAPSDGATQPVGEQPAGAQPAADAPQSFAHPASAGPSAEPVPSSDAGPIGEDKVVEVPLSPPKPAGESVDRSHEKPPGLTGGDPLAG